MHFGLTRSVPPQFHGRQGYISAEPRVSDYISQFLWKQFLNLSGLANRFKCKHLDVWSATAYNYSFLMYNFGLSVSLRWN